MSCLFCINFVVVVAVEAVDGLCSISIDMRLGFGVLFQVAIGAAVRL